MGAMREEAQGRQELAGESQTDARLASEQEATAAGSAFPAREDDR